MSHQQAWIRFDLDGLLMYAEYDGTSDQILTPIYRTNEECRAAWRSGAWAECSCGNDEPAEYAESYGGGSHGPVRACRHCLAITDRSAFYVNDEYYASGPQGGIPDWVDLRGDP